MISLSQKHAMQLNASLAKSMVVLNEGFSCYLRSIFEIFISFITTKMLIFEKIVRFRILYLSQNY